MTNEERSAMMKALWADPAYREKVMRRREEANWGLHHSAKMKELWAIPEYKNRVEPLMRTGQNTPEYHEKRVELNRQMWGRKRENQAE
ncbi:MAG: hypothetical protein ABSH41_19740 [Syntrophobacteraceae bacterium]